MNNIGHLRERVQQIQDKWESKLLAVYNCEDEKRAKQIGDVAAEERTLARDALTKEVLVKMARHSCSHPPTWAKELLKLWQ